MSTVDQWFGPKRRFQSRKEGEAVSGTTLIVLHSSLFRKQDQKGGLTDEFSESMIRQAAGKFTRILIWSTSPSEVLKRLESFVLALDLENVEVMYPSPDRYDFSATEMLKQRIIRLGGRIKHVKNPREINALNIDRFVIGGSITFARAGDAERLGLEVDKPQSFDDLNKKRRGRSFW